MTDKIGPQVDLPLSREGRKNYWDRAYFQYWKARVDEANASPNCTSQMVSNDKPTSTDDAVVRAVKLLNIPPGSRILDLACGYGRSFPYLQPASKGLVGVDISTDMISAAREQFGKIPGVEFLVSEAESIPLPSESFDRIFFFALLTICSDISKPSISNGGKLRLLIFGLAFAEMPVPTP